MPDKYLPVTVYTIRHRESNGTRDRPCVHFITYGLFYGPTKIRFHTVLRLNLSDHKPPPQHLCDEFTGLDHEIVDSFFSIPANEEEFQSALSKLKERVKLKRPQDCVAVEINCNAGRHRSVAMAERLAKAVRRWDGVKAECLHLDLEKGLKIQKEKAARARATEMPDYVGARGHRRSEHKTEARSEARVSEMRPREAAASATSAIEAPLRRKTASWRTSIPVREPCPQQGKTASGSADHWEEVEIRRRLSYKDV